MGASCIASGALEVQRAMQTELEAAGFGDKAVIEEVGCLGPCSGGPVVVVGDVFYENLKPEHCGEIVRSQLVKGQIVERLAHRRPDGRIVARLDDMEFFRRQTKIVLSRCGRINPQKIADYIAEDGYQALASVLQADDPAAVLREMEISGLRGRGGAGFPTFRKWLFARSAPGDQKFAVCNADEGDPGAFMDRSILEGDPHSVMEGMAIAAYTIGASQGYIYVRAEYPLAVQRLRVALGQARELGLLGKNILGSGFDFELEIRMGAGAFVCGEETALLTSIEGNRGEPRPRPPFPAQSGLWHKPTLLNNVETYANVPSIILKGGNWYASHGNEKSKGTKVFALAGAIKKLRARGSAGGHAPGRFDLRYRRRDLVEEGIQGGPDRRPFGWVHSQASPERGSRLRVAFGTRGHHGLGWPDRDGRGQLHGRRGPIFPRIRPGGIVRQVHSLPGGHQADA